MYGYGTEFRSLRSWGIKGVTENVIDKLRFMCRRDFKIVFALMMILWVLQCYAELRLGLRALRSYALYENPQISDPDAKISVLSARLRCVAMLLQFVRITVCILMFFSGVKLLFATTTIIDLILNSVALEFVFTVDELVVHAMLPRHDLQRLEAVNALVVPLRGQFAKFFGAFTGRVGIFWSWFRFGVVVVMVGSICWAHHVIYLAYLSRAQTICLTSGVTDGLTDVDWTEAVVPVVFPYSGVCESFVDAFAGLGTQYCKGFKDHRAYGFTRGFCSYLGDLETAPWYNFDVSGDEFMMKACTQMWFGLDLDPTDKHVPALMDPGQTEEFRDQPRMFGCRNEDVTLEVTRRTNYLYALIPVAADRVQLSCNKPAFGPRSDAWRSNKLHSKTERWMIHPEFFYKFDPKSPVERQADSCEILKPAYKTTPTCDFDRCRVLADVGKGGTCSNYCEKYGLVCAWAAEDTANTCAPKDTKDPVHCDKPYQHTSDLLCECQLHPDQRVCGKLDTVKKRCPKKTGDTQLDPCRVLLNTEKAPGDSDVQYKSCTHYCEHAGLRCVSHYNTKPWSCEPVEEGNKYYKRLTCDDDLKVKMPSRVCECARKDSSRYS